MTSWLEAVGLALAVIAGACAIIWFEREPHPIMAQCIERATADERWTEKPTCHD